MTYQDDAARLEATGDFRVLRRIMPRSFFSPPDGSPQKTGIVIDVETTGLDVTHDEVIEIAMIKFHYTLDGKVNDVFGQFSSFRQPSTPIPDKVVELTGITDSDVAGAELNVPSIENFVMDASIIIAHNASFDRPFCERLSSVFVSKPWACSMKEIAWAKEGFGSVRLSSILTDFKLFFEAHRAKDDCMALLEVLSRPLPKSGELAFQALLSSARMSSVRIWADSAPYEAKHVLRARGYKWSDGTNDNFRSWWIDVSEGDVGTECEFLKKTIYRGEHEIKTRALTAFDRYSGRAVR